MAGKRSNPSAKFNLKRYLKRYPELIELDINPIVDYVKKGKLDFELGFEEKDRKHTKARRVYSFHAPVITDLFATF